MGDAEKRAAGVATEPVMRELLDTDISWDLAALEVDDDEEEEDFLTLVLLEAESYRVLAQQGIHALHVVTADRDRARAELRALRAERRRCAV